MATPDLENRFTYHPPKDGQAETYQGLRAIGLNFARTIDQQCPDSREKSLALTHLEEAVFWANAAIARNGLCRLTRQPASSPARARPSVSRR